jgi:hypothetical protein
MKPADFRRGRGDCHLRRMRRAMKTSASTTSSPANISKFWSMNMCSIVVGRRAAASSRVPAWPAEFGVGRLRGIC